MSGWGQAGGFGGDVAPGPVVGWEVPTATPGLSVREAVGAAWRIYRRQTRTLVALAAIPQAAVALTLVPTLILFGRIFDAMVHVFGDIDPEQFRTDPEGYNLLLQSQFQTAMRPEPELLLLTGLASGLAVIVGLVGTTLLTAAAMDIVDGRRASIGGAFRAVGRHGNALIVPGLVIGLLTMIVTVAPNAATPSVGSASFATREALTSVLGLLGFVLFIAEVVLVVRWAVAIPAILSEDLGLRAGLARSAALTQGVRVRILLAFVVLGVLVGVVSALIAFTVALIAGVGSQSFIGGAVAYLVAILACGAVFSPLTATLIAHLYRLRAPLVVPTPVSLETAGEPAETAGEPLEPPTSS